MALLVLTLLLSFTGYLLPWDQLAFWAVTVGTNMAAATPFVGAEGPFHGLLGITSLNDARFLLLGDMKVGGNALLRFYVMHCVGAAAGGDRADDGALLAGAKGRRHLAAAVRQRLSVE